MSIRSESIARTFTAWLQRYSPPQMMKDKPEVMQDETENLLRVILKFAPQADYDGWVARALDRLEYQMKTRAWPTKGELGAVCSNMRKEAPRAGGSTEVAKSPQTLMAERMNRGEAVGDEWLYGRRAVELLRSGEISIATMKQYRSALWFSMVDAWGEDKAKAHEASLLAKHDAAANVWNGPAPDMPVGSPIKRMEAAE